MWEPRKAEKKTLGLGFFDHFHRFRVRSLQPVQARWCIHCLSSTWPKPEREVDEGSTVISLLNLWGSMCQELKSSKVWIFWWNSFLDLSHLYALKFLFASKITFAPIASALTKVKKMPLVWRVIRWSKTPIVEWGPKIAAVSFQKLDFAQNHDEDIKSLKPENHEIASKRIWLAGLASFRQVGIMTHMINNIPKFCEAEGIQVRQQSEVFSSSPASCAPLPALPSTNHTNQDVRWCPSEHRH